MIPAATANTGGTNLSSVGVIGAFPMARRKELFAELQPLVTDFAHHPWNWAAAFEGAAENRRDGQSVEPRARTSRSSRCGPSGWSRSATTTWRGTASGTPPSSSGGGPTATRNPAATTSSKRRFASTSPTFWLAGSHRRRSHHVGRWGYPDPER